MKLKKIDKNLGILRLTKKEIDGIAKCTFFIEELRRKKGPLFKSLIDFLLCVRNGFFQITE